jgi:hypothetical protein
MADNGDVDSEAGETYLRRVVEATLREYADEKYVAMARVSVIARALTTVGGLDQAVATRIQQEFALAVGVRAPVEPRSSRGTLGHLIGRVGHTAVARVSHSVASATYQGSATVSHLGSYDLPASTVLAVPVVTSLHVDTADVGGDVWFTGYARTDSAAWLTVNADLVERRARPGSRHPGENVFSFFEEVTVEDDRGNVYYSNFNGGGHDGDWSGQLQLDPPPPPDAHWLQVRSGDGDDLQLRIDLETSTPPPVITVTPSQRTPGEQYLWRLAGEYGAAADVAAIADALRAVGVLPAGSEVPERVAAFLEGTDPDGPPLHWRREVTRYSAIAGFAIALPEVDGVTMTLLGLRTGPDGSVTRLHASGMGIDGADDSRPALWIRDAAGWHSTVRAGSSAWSNDTLEAELGIVPPLGTDDWIEVLVTGLTNEILARASLQWRTP